MERQSTKWNATIAIRFSRLSPKPTANTVSGDVGKRRAARERMPCAKSTENASRMPQSALSSIESLHAYMRLAVSDASDAYSSARVTAYSPVKKHVSYLFTGTTYSSPLYPTRKKSCQFLSIVAPLERATL